MSGKAVCLDLDGTLFDTVPEMCRAANDYLAGIGKPQVDEASARDYVGDGLERFTKRALTGAKWGEPPPSELAAARHGIDHAYARHFLCRDSLYPGVAQTLGQLLADGWQLAVVTNKPAKFTRPLLERHLPKIKFASVVAGDSGQPRKPSPAPVLAALEEMQVKPAAAVMVGDSIADMRAGRAADVAACVAVTYGYHQGEDLGSLADACIDDITLLPAVVAGSVDIEVA